MYSIVLYIYSIKKKISWAQQQNPLDIRRKNKKNTKKSSETKKNIPSMYHSMIPFPPALAPRDAGPLPSYVLPRSAGAAAPAKTWVQRQ